MDHSDVRSVGCKRLCLQALENLQLGSILSELGMSELDTRRALALVAAKMNHPASEREASRWIKDNSSLPELLKLTTPRRSGAQNALQGWRLSVEATGRHQEALVSSGAGLAEHFSNDHLL